MSVLFQPINLARLTLANRIVIPPMCQYSADGGLAGDWHAMHYGGLSLSGAGLLIVEATAVAESGRISLYDLGLWDTSTATAMATLINKIRRYSKMPLGIQLAHAGRKGSMPPPWVQVQTLPMNHGGWATVSASSLAFADNYSNPRALNLEEIKEIIADFAAAAKRADEVGFELIELHAAHGYLLHQFLSPLSNKRSDHYGGTCENRMRLLLEVFTAVRAVIPTGKPVGVRLSATDWLEGGWDLESSIILSHRLKDLGCDFIHVSSGGIDLAQDIPLAPRYQVPFAKAIKDTVGLPTIAVGLITEAEDAQTIVANNEADMVGIGRGILYNPRWPWEAARILGTKVACPPQYLRCQPHGHKELFDLS